MRLSAEFSRQIPGGPRIEARLEVPLGASSITVLFGPSGCGKTSLLRLLAGLDRPDSGHIQAADEAWFTAAENRFLPARKRRIGFVFQEAALFPHLTVAGNIAFGLEELSAAERQARVAKLVDLVGLGGFEARRPGELSGGQKQRVALARALAPHPQLLLLDEPFASLDRPAAEALRHALRGILKALGIPALLVTHDRSDALALGDSLILLEGGRVLKQAAPAEVLSVHGERDSFDTAALTAVVRAHCLGRREGLLHLRAGSAELFAPDPGGEFTEVHACIRAEGISLERHQPGALTARNRLPAKLLALHPHGPLTRVSLDCGFPADALITTWAAQDLELKPGDQVIALIKAAAIEVVAIER